MNVLLGRGWRPEQTLLYLPHRREGYDAKVMVVGKNVNIGEDRQLLWMFSTIGLAAVEQPPRGAARSFRRVELVLVVSSSEQEDPFPARLGIALAHEPQPLPGWDWSQVKAPPLVDWLSIAGEELALAIDAGSTFAIQDTLTLGPGGSTWTRSRLSHSVLLPANPHLRGAGFGPFGARVGSPGNVTYADWHLAADTEEHECGFYWLLPVTRAEHARADTDGTWNMFADLAASSHELGGDDFALSYDLLR